MKALASCATTTLSTYPLSLAGLPSHAHPRTCSMDDELLGRSRSSISKLSKNLFTSSRSCCSVQRLGVTSIEVDAPSASTSSIEHASSSNDVDSNVAAVQNPNKCLSARA